MFSSLSLCRIEEYWDPVLNGLDQIVVTRRVPAVHILLTLDAIDVQTSGYQTTNVPTKFWPVPKSQDDKDYVFRQKKGNGNNSSNRGRGSSQQSLRHKPQSSAREGEEGTSKNRNTEHKSKVCKNRSEGKMDVS
jgi:hypothetical protein